MLKSIRLDNVTVFKQADLSLCNGINVIIGENGCGKSHLLKVAYAALAVGAPAPDQVSLRNSAPTKRLLQRAYGEKLINIFRPALFGRLVRRDESQCSMQFECVDSNVSVNFEFSSRAGSDVKISKLPKQWLATKPVFFPARELMTSYSWLPSLYKNYHVEIDESYVDTCDLLGALPVKGEREKKARELLRPIEEAMGGALVLDINGRFFLQTSKTEKTEVSMLAEGLRKLAMMARLIANGTLLDGGCLFWDEPEANLNPKLIKVLAKAVLALSASGVQVILATHSLFLLREIEILSLGKAFNKLEQRYFALKPTRHSGVVVEQGYSVEDLATLVLLDEELAQSDRYLDEE
ncbi:MAG: AAA family ATPase [Endozoicomonas sp.]